MPSDIFNQLTPLISASIAYIPRLIAACVLLFVGFKVQPYFTEKIRNFFEEKEYDESLEKFIQSLLGIAYKIGIILVAISIAGIQTASIVAELGAAGFAVGLALQGSMSNFASGILILTLKPIAVGDFIEISDYMGVVHRIEIFNTVLLTLDNKTIIVPNAEITNNVLINYSKQKKRRVDLNIGVDYTTNLAKARKVIEGTLAKYADSIIDTPKYQTTVRVEELADSAVVLGIFVWCNVENYATVKFGLLEDIKTNFEKADISIPYQTITIKQ